MTSPADHNKPFSPAAQRLSNFVVAEKAAEAKALLNNSVLKEALSDIYSAATGTLAKAEVGSLTATGAHAMVKAVIELQAKLEEYVSDDKMRQKYNKGDK
jgi:hypothetical protein